MNVETNVIQRAQGCGSKPCGACPLGTPGAHPELCAACHIKRYPAGSQTQISHWHKGGAVLLEGIMVAGTYDSRATNGFLATGIAGPGDPISTGHLLQEERPGGERRALSITDCTVALIAEGALERAFSTDPAFARSLFSRAMGFCGDSSNLAAQTCARDSYSAVRYVVAWCAQRGCVDLTHEKIALMCNRSRPTVTEAMHRLAAEEPDLFAPPAAEA